ncbi:MAG: molybdopterin molybdotransferase MoeA [Gammaproteobacteria bacterium]|nr:molybdopterin molybdotransferase MoeA [Gammaproteobacteria bacterium]
MLNPAEADSAIAAHLTQFPVELLSLPACAGRVLRQDVHAERDAPPFDRVAMDGIAIAIAAFRGGRREFRVVAMQAAGHPPVSLDSPADCIEVMTGASLPVGCDTVIPVERIHVVAGIATIEAAHVPDTWMHVHRRAADARAGDRLLASGTRLGGPELAIAASAGQPMLRVSRQPRIAVVSTGDELVEPGVPVLDHQVRRSNSYGLAAALRLAGYPPTTDLHLPDQRPLLVERLSVAIASHDVLVLSGGVSAGRHDHVPEVLGEIGVRCVFHQVSQRPGRPLWFGVNDRGVMVFALPGNPVSVLVCLARYVIPALSAAAGAGASPWRTVALASAFEFRAPLTCFLPALLEYDSDGRTLAAPRPTGGSGDFISLAGTDGFVELPQGPATHPAGLVVPFYGW